MAQVYLHEPKPTAHEVEIVQGQSIHHSYRKWDAVSGRVVLDSEVTKKYIMADEKKEARAFSHHLQVSILEDRKNGSPGSKDFIGTDIGRCYGGPRAGVFGSRYSASNLEIKLVNTAFWPLQFTIESNAVTMDVYAVQGLKEPLLGWSAVESLGILQWVDEINQLCNKFDPQEKYPKLFEGLDLIAATYTLRLKNDVVLVSLHAPHRVALPLQPKLDRR
ncbi:hypothetical protein PR048_022143 [Dryococelus australis]|uniref:Uncharacterized protein n=1 Tax=Dryococelus australis TaxID=614101 RepID=A0ABQ9H0E9_9NEOP|nr:hypothetical protein PR048_022143 [Dryococelus australis]